MGLVMRRLVACHRGHLNVLCCVLSFVLSVLSVSGRVKERLEGRVKKGRLEARQF